MNANEPNCTLLGEDAICCKDSYQSGQGGQKECCVESWDKKLSEAKDKASVASATATAAENSFNHTIAWDTLLRKLVADAEAAHEKAKAVEAPLVLFDLNLGRLRANAENTRACLRIVLCELKKLLDGAWHLVKDPDDKNPDGKDPIYKDPDGKKKDGTLIHDLKKYIENLSAIDEKKRQEALGCITTYETKAREIDGLRADLLERLLKALRLAELIASWLELPPTSSPSAPPPPVVDGWGCKTGTEPGTETGKVEKQKIRSLSWQIEDLLQRIKGEVGKPDETKKDDCRSDPGKVYEHKLTDPPCGNWILKPRKPLLPICRKEPDAKEKTANQQDQKKPGGCEGNYYYGELLASLEKSKKAVEKYREQLAEDQKARDTENALAASLEAAVKAAKEAKEAK